MKGLLSVSFGTSYADTRAKTIDVVDELLAAAFPDQAFYSAWTSGRIVAKVRAERGEQHDTLEEAFARLSADGVDELTVATMCLMNGGEMRKIARAVESWLEGDASRSARLATPLLSSAEDREVMAQAILNEFSTLADDEVLLLMGHGSPSGPNEVYGQIQDRLAASGRPRFFVATVEGTPVFDDALAAIEACGASKVHIAPFMIVAGDHATNDMVKNDDSWQHQLEAHGFDVEATLKGLGQYPAVQGLVVEHARNAREFEAYEG